MKMNEVHRLHVFSKTMKTIGWIKIQSKKYGGVIYGEKVREALSRHFDVELINIDSKYFKRGYWRAPELFLNLLKLKGEKDLWIREDFYPAFTLGLDKISGKNMGLIFHVDFSSSPFFSKPIDFFLEKIIYRSLKKADFIVTISEYWRNHFLERGYKNVFKIYPSFDLSEFDVSQEETSKFKKDYHLEGKPIIYIGNCQKAKGAWEAYELLKDLDVHLITSGEPMIEIPARNLNLSRRDYLKLLKASSVAVAMSKFKEGWNMTAHEAMLFQTPVVGAGLGGMKELLEGGKQIICENFNSLKKEVEYLLNHPQEREKIGRDGYDFAKNFTRERFQKDWLNLLEKII